MTITITHRGTPPEDLIWKGSCHACQTQIECKEADGKLHHGDQREGPSLSLPCPVCGRSMNAYRKTGFVSQWDR